MRSFSCTLFALVAYAAVLASQATVAHGQIYADPGWAHILDGSSAFYNDPDGPNPDYINGTDANMPGGLGSTAALIDPGLNEMGQVDNANALWRHQGSQWEGSAPGDPLGGEPTGIPPVPPPAPGGVGTFTQGSDTYLRLQDAGNPQSWGWADKNQQAGPGAPRQEGNNRRIQFSHPMSRVPGFSGNHDVMDRGITLSFRARIATTAGGPLDMVYLEAGPSGGSPLPWPADGLGYPVSNNGRGMFMITQTGANGPGQLAFSLFDTNTNTAAGLSIPTTGLVMNNRAVSAAGGSPDTGDATAETLNMVEIDNAELTDWHEFWINVVKLPVPDNGSTHEVKVWRDGSLTPEVFQVILGNQNEFGTDANLGLGLSSGTRAGGFDVDFLAYKEGLFEPELNDVGVDGDYNGDGSVNAADYAVWRDTVGSTTDFRADGDGNSMVNGLDYDYWRARFGNTSGNGSSAAVPEPTTALLLGIAISVAASLHAALRK
jgi:hypothetical protein